MSKFYKPVTTSLKHRNLQWINGTVHLHDMHCHCNEPLKHLIFGILEQEPHLQFNKEESQQLQKCLTTGDHTEDAGDVIGEGELDRLFEEDVFGEEDHTG